MNKGLSRAQQGEFRPLLRKAFVADYARTPTGSDDPVFRAWYEAEMYKAFRVKSTTDLVWIPRRFDELMLHFGAIAMDIGVLNKYSAGEERRVRWQIRRYMVDLAWLEQRQVDWNYVEGIYHQSQLGCPHCPWSDAPASMLIKVLQMLDTYIRRLAAKHHIRAMQLPTRSDPIDPEFCNRVWPSVSVDNPIVEPVSVQKQPQLQHA